MAVTYQALVGWGGSPYNRCVPWTDVSSRLVKFGTKRGRSTEMDAIETATASVVLDSPDGMFTPGKVYGANVLNYAIAATGGFNNTSGFTAGPKTTISSQNTVNRRGGGTYDLMTTVPTTVGPGDVLWTCDPQPVAAGLPYAASGYQASNVPFSVNTTVQFFDVKGVSLGSGGDAGATLDAIYRGVVLNDFPVQYNRLESAASPPQNSTDSNLYLTFSGGTATAGRFGPLGANGYTLSGQSYASAPDMAVLGSGDRTVEFWFCTTGASTGVLFASGNNATPGTTSAGGSMPLAYVGNDGKLRAGFYTGTTTMAGTSPAAVNDGLWHHVMLTVSYANNTQTVYLDGAAIGTNNTPTWDPDNHAWLGCGETTAHTWPAITGLSNMVNGWSFFQGQVQDFAYYNYQATASQASAHYAAGIFTTRRLSGTASSSGFTLCQGAAVAPKGAVSASVQLVSANPTGVAASVYSDTLSLSAANPFVPGWSDHVMPDVPIQLNEIINGNLAPLNMANVSYGPLGQNVGSVGSGPTDPDVNGAWALDANTTSTVGGTTAIQGQYALYDSTVGGLVFTGSGANATTPNRVTYSGRLSHLITPGTTYWVQFKGRIASGPASGQIGIRYETQYYGAMNTIMGTSSLYTPNDWAATAAWQTFTTQVYVPSVGPSSLFNDVGLPNLAMHLYSYNSAGTAMTVAVKEVQIYPVSAYQSPASIPAFTLGDGSVPLYSGFVDSWTADPLQSNDLMEVTAACSDLFRHLGAVQVSHPYRSQVLNDPLLHNYWDLYDQNCTDLGPYANTGSYGVHPASDGLQHAFSYQLGGLIYATVGNASATSSTAVSTSGGPSSGFTPVSGTEYSPFWGLGSQNNSANITTGNCMTFNANGMNPCFPAKGSEGHGSFDLWFALGATSAGTYTLIGRDFGTSPVGQVVVKVYSDGNGRVGFPIGYPSPGVFTTFSYPQATTQANHLLIRWRVVGGMISFEGYLNGARRTEIGATFTYAGPPVAWSYFGADFPTWQGPAQDVWQGQMGHVVYSNRKFVDPGSRYIAGINPSLYGYMPGSVVASAGLDVRWDSLGNLGQINTAPTGYLPNCYWSGTGVDAALQAIAVQLGGTLYISGAGNPCFQVKSSSVPIADFSDGTGPDAGMIFYDTLDKIVNWVTVSDSNGNSGTFKDSASVERYGKRSMAVGTSFSSGTPSNVGAYSGVIGNGILAAHSQPRVRCDMARFTCVTDALKTKALALDIGSRVQFSRLPAPAPSTVMRFFVESISISVDLEEGRSPAPVVDVGLSPDYF
jgi:hypothetical protein